MEKPKKKRTGIQCALWTVLLFVVIGALIGFGFGAVATKQAYVAHTQLSIDSTNDAQFTDYMNTETLAEGAVRLAKDSSVTEEVRGSLGLSYSSIQMRTMLTGRVVNANTFILTASAESPAAAEQLANEAAVVLSKAISHIAVSTAVTVDQAAQAPEHPSAQKADQITLFGASMGLYAGLILVVLVALIHEVYLLTRTRVRSSEDIRKCTMPILTKLSHWGEAGAVNTIWQADAPKRECNKYGEIRMTLDCYAQKGRKLQVLVTSSRYEEGKSQTAVNLAASYAMAGQRVLLLDADMKHPEIHKFFDMSQENGLSEALSQNRPRIQARDSGVENLYIMPAGQIPSRSDELLKNPHFHQVFTALKEKFDVIIVSAPGIIDQRDTELLTKEIHLGLLSVQLGQTKRKELYEAQDILSDCNVRMAGVIFNNFS